MGVNPYINASIIMQLMTGVVPRLQALSREGEYGRTKINQYTRYLTVPLALLQAYGYLAILSRQRHRHRLRHPVADDADARWSRSPPAQCWRCGSAS